MNVTKGCNIGNEEYNVLSEVCTNGSDTSNFECVKIIDETTMLIRYASGIWFLLISLLGTFGNLATLICIPFSARRRLFGFDKNFSNTTIFILNISLIGFCRCFLFTFPTSISLFTQKWLFGTFLCKLDGYILDVTLYAELIGLNIIGISRCLGLQQNTMWSEWCIRGINSSLLIILTWVPCFVLVIPSLTGFEAGWMCEVGVCDVFYRNIFWDWICTAFILLLTLSMCFLYILILIMARSSTNNIKRIGSVNIKLESRNSKVTQMVLSLISVSVVCNLAVVLIKLEKTLTINMVNSVYSAAVYQLLVSIAETQFACDTLLYAITNDQYRNAYIAFWRWVTCQEIQPKEVTKNGSMYIQQKGKI